MGKLAAILLTTLVCCQKVVVAAPFVMGHLMGQLGNQLFIIAATTSLALDNGAIPIFPDLATSTEYNIPINYEKVFYHLNAPSPQKDISVIYREPSYTYSPIPYQNNMMIFGYFQSEKYFIKHKKEIQQLFAPHSEIMDYLKSRYPHIFLHPYTVAVHVRSYKNEDPLGLVYADPGIDYYEKAMSLFPDEALFVVFSNDMARCKQQFANIRKNIQFIEGEHYIHDFYLMRCCHHQIICNSTFSWWAAYLNQNKDKIVIVPPVWFNPRYHHQTDDLIPKNWIILQDYP